jgi:hypothetical protein
MVFLGKERFVLILWRLLQTANFGSEPQLGPVPVMVRTVQRAAARLGLF